MRVRCREMWLTGGLVYVYLCVSQTSREDALRVPPAFAGRRKERSDELDVVALQNEQLKAFLKGVQNKAPR